jgi:alcohol dehydrogenase YqhD (iron-dependent ADH family)
MENYEYSNPVKLLYGKDQLEKIADEILPFGRRVLLVYGQKHLKSSGVYDKIVKLLNEKGLDVYDLEGVKPNPRVSLVRKGVEICKNRDIDFILAAGGGSCSDTAKAIGIGARIDYDVWQTYEDFHNIMHQNDGDFSHVPNETIPVGVIMTKPGTGSDFDYTSVLSNRETKEKLMVINKVLYPVFSVHDPTLAYTLPKEERKFGVADIMTHYMEQYFTITKNTLVLDRIKEAGLRTVIESGKTVLDNPEDYTAQSDLLYCAAWACSDQSMTGAFGAWASHQIEHEITAITDLNHGNGMAIVYIGWMKYILPSLPEKFARFAQKVWKIPGDSKSDIELGLEGIEKTASFWESLGITLSLSKAGVDLSIIPQVAKQAVRFGPLGLIKQLKEQDVINILESVK